MKKFVTAITCLLTLQTLGQTGLVIQPQQPRAGELIRFEYSQSGDLSGLPQLPQAYVLQFSSKGNKIIDIPLKRSNGQLVGSFQSDSAASLLAFGFAIDDKIDDAQDSGYLVPLYQEGHPKAGSNAGIAAFYRHFGDNFFGVSSDPQKAVTYYQREFEAYPESRSTYIMEYLSTLMAVDKQKGAEAVQLEIENKIKAGLTAKQDYTELVNLYSLAGLRQQRMFFTQLGNEKFPGAANAAPGPQEYYQRFEGAEDNNEKAAILQETLAVADTSANKEAYNPYIGYFQRSLLSAYAAEAQWDLFDKLAATIKEEKQLAQAYNSIAWKLQESGKNLDRAEKLAAFASRYARKQWKDPEGPKPDMLTARKWADAREAAYATYADTYAMVLYKAGKAKKALPYAKEAAIDIHKGQETGLNKTYALVAAKALSSRKYIPMLEQFVKDGKSDQEMNELLRAGYLSKHPNGNFDQYLGALEKEALLKMRKELENQVLNSEAPDFALKDLEGHAVQLDDLRDKVVVVDFWATWCGPCKASFPGMKKMVANYKADSSVVFLFVNTWENAEDKLKNAKDFIEQNNYSSFHVLLDEQDKVVKDFDVSGIPTKFVIGRDGKLKFKSIGFNGEDHLVKELPVMIDLAAQ
ncbi:hypothetical protein GCM10027051_25810 [Niabella terrae]